MSTISSVNNSAQFAPRSYAGASGSVPETQAEADAVAARNAGDDTESAEELPPSSRVQPLSEAETREAQALKARDREVRAHEQAHLAAAGQYAKGGISYTYERGPDGRLYAVGGEVSVDTSEVPNDPEATLQKAQTLQRAALAPAAPSAQDRAVAAEMSRMALEARQEIAAQAFESTSTDEVTDDTEKVAIESREAAPLICPSCGGAHSASNHDGMTAYNTIAESAD